MLYFPWQKAIGRGIKTVRVKVKGLGPGRLVIFYSFWLCYVHVRLKERKLSLSERNVHNSWCL